MKQGRATITCICVFSLCMSVISYVYFSQRKVLSATRSYYYQMDMFSDHSLHRSYLQVKSSVEKYPDEYNTSRVSKPCDNECTRLREVFRNASWPADKPKAFIYMLTTPNRFPKLTIILKQLDEYFLNRFKYPVVLFHEGEYDRGDAQTELRQHTSSLVIFQKVEFKLPQVHQYPVQFQGCCCYRMGYRHMCRFHAFTVYQMAIFQGIDYIWRLDDDSQIIAPIKLDIFQFMQNKNLTYGYAIVSNEAPDCILGLYEATRFFYNQTNLKAKLFKSVYPYRVFYNNFEISRLSLWHSREYLEYMVFLEALNGIYRYRWGDAPIKTLAVQMFVPHHQIYRFQFPEISYRHKSLSN